MLICHRLVNPILYHNFKGLFFERRIRKGIRKNNISDFVPPMGWDWDVGRERAEIF